MSSSIPHITVCICTFQRPGLLRQLLEKLEEQDTGNRFTYSVVVSDNDRLETARTAVEAIQQTGSLEVVYVVEPEQNIALARNRALTNARGDYVAFIDDDELPPNDWLLKMLQCCVQHESAGVLGPVRPRFEHQPPRWLTKGKFFHRPEHLTGTILDWTETRSGNVLLRREILDGIEEPFRRQFGSGSEDTDFFQRLIARGHRFTWCNEASVYELVPEDRCSRRYMVRRALLRGQNKRHTADLRGIAKSCAGVLVYAAALPVFALVGQHLFMRHLVSFCDHLGKLIGVLGFTPMGDKYITSQNGGLPAIQIETSKASCLPR